MKLLIGTLITAIALMTLPMNGWSGDKEDRQFKRINLKRCAQGISEACETLKIIAEMDACEKPKKKQLKLTPGVETLTWTLQNQGLPKITVHNEATGEDLYLYPCDTLTLRIRGEWATALEDCQSREDALNKKIAELQKQIEQMKREWLENSLQNNTDDWVAFVRKCKKNEKCRPFTKEEVEYWNCIYSTEPCHKPFSEHEEYR